MSPSLGFSDERQRTFAKYNTTLGDFYGGNFWDARATGYRLQNSAAEQGQDPPSDPEEMANLNPACVVKKLSLSKYEFFFEQIPLCCLPADAGAVVPNHAATQITAGPELEIANETLAINSLDHHQSRRERSALRHLALQYRRQELVWRSQSLPIAATRHIPT